MLGVGAQNIGLSNRELNVHRVITLHGLPRQTDGRTNGRTDGQTDGQADEQHGNSATIRSNERIKFSKRRE